MNEQEAKILTAVKQLAKEFCVNPREFLDASRTTEENIVRVLLKYAETTQPIKINDAGNAALDATEKLKTACMELQTAIKGVEELSTEALLKTRSSRMSLVTEIATSLKSLRDLRQFFLGPDHEQEQKRLAEFVEVCERLKALKDSGFLDTVADTMIRLSNNTSGVK